MIRLGQQRTRRCVASNIRRHVPNPPRNDRQSRGMPPCRSTGREIRTDVQRTQTSGRQHHQPGSGNVPAARATYVGFRYAREFNWKTKHPRPGPTSGFAGGLFLIARPASSGMVQNRVTLIRAGLPRGATPSRICWPTAMVTVA